MTEIANAVKQRRPMLKNAAEAGAGDITPGHTLASLVAALTPQQNSTRSTRSTRPNNREQQ